MLMNLSRSLAELQGGLSSLALINQRRLNSCVLYAICIASMHVCENLAHTHRYLLL